MRYVGKRDLKVILEHLGIIMQAIGFVVLLPIFVALIYGEGNYIGFLIPSAISITIGTLLKKFISGSGPVRLKHGMMVAGLAWLWAALIGSMVLMLLIDIDFVNAYFESISAWTGSGLTIFSDVEILPKSVLFLRSLEQWIGGLGVVIVVIGILIRPGTAASRLYKSEAREERIKPSISNTVKTIWWIYLFYTVLGVVLYGLAGMPLFDAINNTMTNLSTGGMSIKNDNIGSYGSDLIYYITIFLMIVGGTSFLVHYKVFKGKLTRVFKDIQFRAMLIIIILFSALIIINRYLLPIDSVFHVVSALTCTGSNIQTLAEMQGWAGYVKIIIIMAMIIGGAAGSTTGAIKLIRLVTIFKGIYWEIMRIVTPEGSVIPRKISGKSVSDVEIREASAYTSIYFIFIFISWLLLSSYGYDTLNSLFEVVSAQGNVGLSMGITTAEMPVIPKIFLMFNMWLGRLEIIPVMVLFRAFLEVFKRN
ncbi:TrkH family potassium uptake protein [Methanobacterium alkalithermotolerans]|uniref:TrkH family potassium uptake protein n=1 Tax=Methanobacterium alkalithermotolerans TaxID=2731220 RepID=A0A8T8K801_9EURY|nr:TrkH family potassium uptake protein [Methanobacterium alkalithermotolerans]QUH23253.1 TrkH family potassium uptake protein [Methanobacterium alkalithermotolerans]